MTMTNELLLPGWERDGEHNITRVIDADTHVTIHKYPNYASQFCCHIIRGEFRHCPGLAFTMADAIDACEKHLAMPIADFKLLMAADKVNELQRILRELKRLGHDAEPAMYAAGFTDGYKEARTQLHIKLAALAKETEPSSCAA